LINFVTDCFPDSKIKYWIDLSDYDLETAEAMFQSKRFLYVGFMCHQTIEKDYDDADFIGGIQKYGIKIT
jgi:hypothetical protein